MNYTAPTVSVITPCYNGGRFLRATIDSVLGQTLPVLEMIVVDDGSTDDSAAIAESFGGPVRVIRQANQGESVARNVAIREARGEYLQFLDADDLLAPDAIEKKAAAVSGHPGAVAVSRVAFFTDDPTRPTQVGYLPGNEWFPHIIGSNFGAPHAWLAPRETVLAVSGFDASLRWFEDWELWTRVALMQPRLVPVDHAGALYRQHPQSQLATTKDADRARGHAAVTARLGERMLQRPDLLAAHGEPLFWALWTSLRRAREKGVGFEELEPVMAVLRELVVVGPANVRAPRLAKMMRLLGPKWTSRIHAWTRRDSSWSASAAAV